jgi:hypothetical protein
MKIRRSLTVLSAATLLAFPFATQADSDHAMEACIKAFVGSTLADQKVTIYRKPALATAFPGYDAHASRIDLVAARRDSGKEVAHATCVVNSSGVVTTMEGTTPDAVAAR